MALTIKFKRACAECGPVGSYFCGLLYVLKAYYLFIQFFDAYFTYLSKIDDSSTIYQVCVNRVSSDQAALFDPSNLQSNLSLYWGDDASTFNSTLCDLGFVGNSDIYGLGVRSGLYIQWVTSLLANHLLREESTALMRSYLIFHIALCIAVAVLTFQKNCTFVVEIVLLYYLVYGGFICVFSRPNLGDFEPATVGLHWSQVVLILSFFAMVIHVVWFVVFGHFSLPNMPCETTIFFFGPVKGPWMDAWLLWLAVILLAIIYLVVSGTTFLLCAFCLIYAIKILVSIVQLPSASLRNLRFSEILEWLAAQPDSIRNKYGSALSRYFRAYTMSRPVHGQQRRIDQIIFLAVGVFTLVWSILAIELTIHWNNISDMYALDTTGQYVPLTVGLGGFVRLLYGLLKLWLNPNKKHPDPHGIEFGLARSHEAAESGSDASDFLNVGPSDTPLERRIATF